MTATAIRSKSSELSAHLPDLEAELRALLAQVPPGKVTTYGDLAAALGNPIAARWVGHFMLHHEHAPGCTCHRVVRANGQLGGYVGGKAEEKRRLLQEEGAAVGEGAVVELDRYRFAAFQGTRPLQQLQALQQQVGCRVRLVARRRIPPAVGGVDLAYSTRGVAVAAYALVDSDSGALLWRTTVTQPVRFPYITSYLAFRELPVLLELIEEVRRAGRLSTVVLVDGSGVLHPRRAGIASHLGVVADLPTVGVTKSHLCGRVELPGMKPLESRPVIHAGKVNGVALRATRGSRRPLFVSPGHRTNLRFAEQLVRRFLRGHRLPEPLYWADRQAREVARRL